MRYLHRSKCGGNKPEVATLSGLLSVCAWMIHGKADQVKETLQYILLVADGKKIEIRTFVGQGKKKKNSLVMADALMRRRGYFGIATCNGEMRCHRLGL